MSTTIVRENVHMSNITFGTWLKEQRALRRMSQVALEERADLSDKHVSKFETGNYGMPTEDVRLRIHEALGTTEEDLVEAGLLRRMQYQGRVWYVPIRDEGRASQDAPPIPGALPLADVASAFTDAARGMVWTPAMVQAIVQQIKMYGDLQAGAAQLPAVEPDEPEAQAGSMAAGE